MPIDLEGLPAEIQRLILRQSGDLRSLFSLVRASPSLFRIYVSDRNKILLSIVCNQITAEWLPIAYAALKLRKVTRRINAKTPLRIDKLLKYDLIDTTLLSASEAKELIQYHTFIEDRVTDSIGVSLRFLKNRESNPSKAALDVSPSPTERRRVTRGFYNWELFSILSQYDRRAHLAYMAWGSGFLMRCPSFVNTLTFHECEETAFVMQYVHDSLADWLGHVEDDRIAQFLERELENTTWSSKSPDSISDYWLETGSAADKLFFSHHYHDVRTGWENNFLLVRGLRLLQEIIDLPKTREARLAKIEEEARSDIRGGTRLAQVMIRDQRNTLMSTAGLDPLTQVRQSLNWPDIDFSTCPFDEFADSPALGSVWAYTYPCTTQHAPNTQLLDQLVRSGLAIWDARRLRQMDIFSKNPSIYQCPYRPWALRVGCRRELVEQRARKLIRDKEARDLKRGVV